MQSNSRPLIIGITGSIASGKTLACAILEKVYPVFYADKISHQTLDNQDIINAVKDRWGNAFIKRGKPDRKAIANLVFVNKIELDFLNSVIHPKVLQIMQDIIDNSSDKVICFETPLLFEANLADCFDYIVFIAANREKRIERLSKREKLCQLDIQARMENQLDDEIKAAKSDLIINNNGSRFELREKVLAFIDQIPNLERKEITPFCY